MVRGEKTPFAVEAPGKSHAHTSDIGLKFGGRLADSFHSLPRGSYPPSSTVSHFNNDDVERQRGVFN